MLFRRVLRVVRPSAGVKVMPCPRRFLVASRARVRRLDLLCLPAVRRAVNRWRRARRNLIFPTCWPAVRRAKPQRDRRVYVAMLLRARPDLHRSAVAVKPIDSHVYGQ